MNSPQRPPHKRKNARSRPLPAKDLAVILRAAADLNQRGGYELLVQVLKGASEPRLRSLGLENSPVYGIYETLATAEIEARIDRAVASGFLELEKSNRSSRILLTPAGVQIERDTLAIELLAEFDERLILGKTIDFSEYSDTDMQTQVRLLDLVAASGDQRFLALLKAWEPFAPRKLRERIGSVQNSLVRQERAR